MTFAADLKRFAEAVKGNADQVVRTATLQFATAVIERTPVGDAKNWARKPPPGYVGGRLRSNWQFAEGSPLTAYLQSEDTSGSLNQIMGGIAKSKAGGVTYLSNNAPYAARIEYEGWSGQAPAGMVRVTVTEFQQYVDSAVRQIKK